jgi:predicted GIY-YIG superfamily endonuclease
MLGLKRKPPVIRHFWLYVIALEQGKYYVGITRWGDPYRRINQHGTKEGATWTRRYKPLKPLRVVRLEDLGVIPAAEAERRENATFEEFRKRYGLRNVRGGNVTSHWSVYRMGRVYFGYKVLSALGSLALVVILLALIYIVTKQY